MDNEKKLGQDGDFFGHQNSKRISSMWGIQKCWSHFTSIDRLDAGSSSLKKVQLETRTKIDHLFPVLGFVVSTFFF